MTYFAINSSFRMWHFYTGTSLTVHIIDDSGKYSSFKLGPNFGEGEVFQGVVYKGKTLVPDSLILKGCWFGATVDAENSFALVGCTVSPGFDFQDFELATYDNMVKLCPEQADLIKRMT